MSKASSYQGAKNNRFKKPFMATIHSFVFLNPLDILEMDTSDVFLVRKSCQMCKARTTRLFSFGETEYSFIILDLRSSSDILARETDNSCQGLELK